MKKLFTLCVAIIAIVGTSRAEIINCVKIGSLYYNLDTQNKIAEVTKNYSDLYTNLQYVYIPASVTYNSVEYNVISIAKNAFRDCSNMKSVTIPNGITNIGEAAFMSCSSLTSVTIPESVKTLNTGSTFQHCTSLTEVQWNAINCKIDSFNVNYEFYPPFYALENITKFSFGPKVEKIPATLCNRLIGLTSIELPSSLKSIEYRAFAVCTGLKSVTIPSSVTSISNEAFKYCYGMTSFTITNPETQCGADVLCWCINLEEISASASALNIYESSVNEAPSHVKSITVTGGKIHENGFLFITHSYHTLQTLDCGAATNTTLADEAFKDCYNLQSLILPQQLTYINYMAVAGCKNLKSIDIPASVEEIEQSAFEDCRSLKELTFAGQKPASMAGKHAPTASQSKLRKIGNWAFYNSHELQHLALPEGLEEVGDAAFYGCTYLQDLVLPASVKSIGDNCFALCSKLQNITVKSPTPPQIDARTFYDVSRAIPVLVPENATNAYKDAPYWNEMNIQANENSNTGGSGSSGSSDSSDDTPDEQSLDQISQEQKAKSQKLLINGQIYILRGDKIYTVTGQETR